MSWANCMKEKIVDHYGPEVKDCVEGITKHNWTDVLKCMVEALGITDPEVWIPAQLVLFSEWSLECAL